LTGCQGSESETITIDLGKNESKTINFDLGEEKSDVSTNVEEAVTELSTEYDTYSGTWTSYGYDENSIYTRKGGAILSISIKNNHLKGTYVYVQDNSYRIASVDDIDTEIIDSIAEFDFSDDGWGNSGKLTIVLGEKVSVNVDEVITNPDNTTGMKITSALLDRENSAEIDTDEDIDIKSIEQEIMNRDSYRTASAYWNDVVEWDEDNGRYGLDRPLEPILCSDQREYTIEELNDYPEEILYLALNEIYARHGYIFKDEDLQNYFMGQVWYTPLVEGENFSDEVFNDYEKENLQLLIKISNR
jgi:hypothetical protein